MLCLRRKRGYRTFFHHRALAALAAILAIGLVVSLASDDDMGMGGNMGMNNGNHSMAMMQAMGNMDSDAMLDHMRQILGEEAYQRMLSHMEDHRNGTPMTGNSAIDQMMHGMMDGMMQQMPDDSGGNMPMGPR